MLHKWRNGERGGPIGQDITSNPFGSAFNKIVNVLQYLMKNLYLRLLLASLLIVQKADISRINGHNVLSFFMYLHIPLQILYVVLINYG